MPFLTSDSPSCFYWVVYFGVRDRTMIDSMTDVTANSLQGRKHHGIEWVWRRLLAGIVDWMLLIGWVFVAVMIVAVATAIAGLFSEYSFQTNFGASLMYFGFPVACVVVVFRHVLVAFRVSSKGDTLGHRLFGLTIVDSSGEIIFWDCALGRHILGSPLLFAYVFPMIVLLIVAPLDLDLFSTLVAYWALWGLIVSSGLTIMNHAWMGFDAAGRGWHDRLMGTVVVRDEGLTSRRSR